MRVAVQMHGLAGNSNKYGTGDCLNLKLAHDHFVKKILDENPSHTIDVFMHTWSEESKEQLIQLYQPKSHLFEEQIHFDFEYIVGNPNLPMNAGKTENGVFIGIENIRFHSLFSRWYSAKSVNELRKQHEQSVGFEYDMILLTRFDLAYLTPVIFDEFDEQKFYAIPPISNHGMHDLLFVSTSEKMDLLCGMFDFVSQIRHFPNWNIHSHYLTRSWVSDKIGENNVGFFGPDRLWDAGKEGAKTGPAPLVRDHYDLLKIKKDDPMEFRKIDQMRNLANTKYRKYSELKKQ
jgi:hypothetical protein